MIIYYSLRIRSIRTLLYSNYSNEKNFAGYVSNRRFSIVDEVTRGMESLTTPPFHRRHFQSWKWVFGIRKKGGNSSVKFSNADYANPKGIFRVAPLRKSIFPVPVTKILNVDEIERVQTNDKILLCKQTRTMLSIENRKKKTEQFLRFEFNYWKVLLIPLW